MTGCSVLRSLCPDALLQEAEGLQDLGQQFLITGEPLGNMLPKNPGLGAGAWSWAKVQAAEPQPDFSTCKALIPFSRDVGLCLPVKHSLIPPATFLTLCKGLQALQVQGGMKQCKALFIPPPSLPGIES